MPVRSLFVFLISVVFTMDVNADIEVSSIFTDHMVVQRDKPIVVWGNAGPGEEVSVSIAGLTGQAKAGKGGRWKATLGALEVGGPHELVIQGTNTIVIKDVLVGEVWICSGQSNMQWSVSQSNDPELERLAATFPKIRLITVPQVGTQTTQTDFEGEWKVCTPETVSNFSAVGYFFGRQLHQTLDVPIGLIDTAWGGSACEAWIPREVLEAAGNYDALLAKWDKMADEYDAEGIKRDYEKRLAEWKVKAEEARRNKKPVPRRPGLPRNPLVGQHRPANLYNGVLAPVVGYPIRGAIWYQGENNASRAHQYQNLFPLMIQTWRDKWGGKDFPFYWVQLADFRDEVAEPGESDWAELREAQTMALDLPNSGQAVITDLGESHDIHPRNKQDVAKRLARWALARDYGFDLVYRSPQYQGHEVKGSKVLITFDVFGSQLDTHDVRDVIGFTIAGEDRKFVKAKARMIGSNQIEVWADGVDDPVSVRYAWANNPICNVQNREHLPLTPFRTDQWDGVTVGRVQ